LLTKSKTKYQMDLLLIFIILITLIRIVRLLFIYVFSDSLDASDIDNIDKFDQTKPLWYECSNHGFFVGDDDLKICIQNYKKYFDFIKSFNPNIKVLCTSTIGFIYLPASSKKNTVRIPWSMLLPQKYHEYLYQTHRYKPLISKPYIDENINKAIILHEVGHIYYNHPFKITILNCIGILIVIANYILFYDQLWLFITILVFEKTIMSYINMRFEYQADLYATKHQYGTSLIKFFMNEDITMPKHASMEMYRAVILQYLLELFCILTIANWYPSLQSRIKNINMYLKTQS
jgi:hypothetical protein